MFSRLLFLRQFQQHLVHALEQVKCLMVDKTNYSEGF